MNALTIESLRKTYPNGRQALKGISLQINEGDFFALLGPNGAGKSTTIGIICSLVNKTSGIVKVFDANIDTDWPLAKSYIGVVPQEMNFNMFEKVENIVVNQAGFYGIPRHQALIRAEICLKEMELWDKRHDAAGALSGGMKRRLMIARAIMHQPKLLILDEPTAGVDIEIRRGLWHFLRRLNEQGTTIVLTTHYLEEAESLCRNIAIISHGEIIENTSMKHLLSQLQIESFILDLQSPLSAAPVLQGFNAILLDDITLEVAVPKQTTLNALFTQLSNANIFVKSLRNKANRLEELFLNVVSTENKGKQ